VHELVLFYRRWGVDAERKPLEATARPLTFIDMDQ
jgi:hypothetical protein